MAQRLASVFSPVSILICVVQSVVHVWAELPARDGSSIYKVGRYQPPSAFLHLAVPFPPETTATMCQWEVGLVASSPFFTFGPWSLGVASGLGGGW